MYTMWMKQNLLTTLKLPGVQIPKYVTQHFCEGYYTSLWFPCSEVVLADNFCVTDEYSETSV